MKIAILGAGISGLTAAYYLSPQHDVTVFEAGARVGGHTNTIDVELDGERQAVDTGFIVFNDRTYPNFCRLMDELQVASQPTTMSFSVRCDRTGLEYRGADLNGFFAQRRNLFRPSFYRFLADLVRFNRRGIEVLEAQEQNRLDEEMSVAEFFRREKFSPQFIEQYFLPMGSAVWSCPRGTFEQFPIRFILEFYRHHGLLSLRDRPQWRVICGGSQQYVGPLTRRFANRIQTNATVQSVQRDKGGVEIRTNDSAARFDHVVFACHSDQALKILGSGATAVERELLGAFPYEENVAVLHTDHKVLPKTKRAWACWNYHLPADAQEKATVTYNMNLLQGLRSKNTFCVTLNGEREIDPTKILRRLVYHHPIFTTQRSIAQRRHAELLGANRSSFCGAYWGNGFHEDGVASALRVVEATDRVAAPYDGPPRPSNVVSVP